MALEHVPFLRNRNMLQIRDMAHVLVGKPVSTFPGHALGAGFKPAPAMPPDLSEMPAAIVRGKRRKDGTPAIRADLAFDHNATVGTYEIRTAGAAFVPLRVVLISSGGLGQFLLILRLVLLRCGSSDAATGRGSGRNAH